MNNLIERLQCWDVRLFTRIFQMNGRRFWDRPLFWISRTGDGYLYLAILPILLVFQPSDGKILITCGSFGFAIKLCIYTIVKKRVKRDRPFEALEGIDFLIAPPDQFSFPSGHTAGAFLVTTIIGTAYSALMLPLLLWSMTVGFSRVYLGVHYPTDVLAGVLLGIGSAKISILLIM